MDNNFFLNSGIQRQSNFDLSSNCFFNTNIDNPIDQFSQFESALSSMVSSPVSASNSAISNPNENFQSRDLVGKLGTICNSGEIPAPSVYSGSTNTSCFATPMDSPPKLNCQINNRFLNQKMPNLGNSIANYPPISGDPGFAERAAKFSCFGSRSFNGRTGQTNNCSELGSYRVNSLKGNNNNVQKLTRVLSSPSLNLGGSQVGSQENNNLGQKQVDIRLNQGSPVSGHIPDFNSKKRKAVCRGKFKETEVALENENSESKRHKDNEGNVSENGSGKTEVEKQGNFNRNENKKEEEAKTPEPPKDYIHVRARRGQATDSHSLAERVRREKISERMKLLQDLVPGCNKVTGKAVMLDEIINYVQTLQRQVEFLSMKLATLNPRLDFHMDNLLHKDVIQPNGTMGHQIDTSASPLFGHHNQKLSQVHNNFISNGANMMDPVHTIFRNTIGLQSSHLDEFSNGLTQFQTLCEGDLQNIVQMGFGRDMGFSSQGFPGSNDASDHMKVEM